MQKTYPEPSPELLALHDDYGKLIIPLHAHIVQCKGLEMPVEDITKLMIARAEEYFDGLSPADQKRQFAYGAASLASLLWCANESGFIGLLASQWEENK